jgi:Mg/Co/Ni transporter MgtE
MEMYQNKSVEEIIEAEAAEGNQAAIQLAADMFTDVNQLIELFQLSDPENKLTIMLAMTDYQRQQLIPMLDESDLAEGLQYFTQDSLLNMLNEIPKEELMKTVFYMFSEDEVIQNMPQDQLDKFLTGVEMDKDLLLKNLQSIPATYLQQILESVTGEEAKGTSNELTNQIGQLGDLAYKTAIRNLEPTQKQQLTLLITSSDNKQYERFDTSAYTRIINRERDKNDLVKAMGNIKPEYLQKMMTELPEDLLSVVITQIDTEKFADSLINKFPELLAQFVAN